MRRCLLMLFALVFSVTEANTPPEITNVRASQRTDTKLVDIYYDAADADGDTLKVRVEISDNDGIKYSVPASTFTGDIGEGISVGKDKHIVWDAGKDWDGEYSDQMRVKIYAIDAHGFPGMEWGNEVPPGGFLMGQDGGAEGSGTSRHVNIAWSYWLSKYEITNQQYCDFLNSALVAGCVQRDGTTAVYSTMGSQVMPQLGGRYLLIQLGDSYDIRWNVNNFEVVGTYSNFPVRVTWYGAMMFAHYYGYDLPTEAEWEKAARGPDNDDQDEHLIYPWGNTISTACANYSKASGTPYASHYLTPVGYYDGNQTPVGNDMVNGYALYDICGNVSEWTLTTSGYSRETYPQQESLVDARNMPVYGVDGSSISRGGSYSGNVQLYNRESLTRSSYSKTAGFRLCRREGGDRPTAVCEIKEDFESWATGGESSTVNATTGCWVLGYYMNVKSGDANAGSGSKYIYSRAGDYLYVPALSGQLVEVRLKVRNPSSSSSSVYLEAGNSTDGWSTRSVSISSYSDYQTISLSPTSDAQQYRLYFYGMYIDDIELWTIPRN